MYSFHRVQYQTEIVNCDIYSGVNCHTIADDFILYISSSISFFFYTQFSFVVGNVHPFFQSPPLDGAVRCSHVITSLSNTTLCEQI